MKKKLLVIFFFSCIFSYIIYNTNINNRKDILILGDNHLLKRDKPYDYYLNSPANNIMSFNKDFVSDNKNYKELISDIKDNYFMIVKEKRIYLNQMISLSDVIIINSSNSEYLYKCNKPYNVLKNYNDVIYSEVNNLVSILNRISSSKIIIIGNYCFDYDKDISNYLDKLYSNFNYINMYELIKSYSSKDDILLNNINSKIDYYLYNSISKIIN